MRCKICGYRTKEIQMMAKHYRKKHPKVMASHRKKKDNPTRTDKALVMKILKEQGLI